MRGRIEKVISWMMDAFVPQDMEMFCSRHKHIIARLYARYCVRNILFYSDRVLTFECYCTIDWVRVNPHIRSIGATTMTTPAARGVKNDHIFVIQQKMRWVSAFASCLRVNEFAPSEIIVPPGLSQQL